MAVDPSRALRQLLCRSALGGDPRQRVLHDAILAVRRADLLPQLGVLRHGHSLELSDDQILRLGQILLQLVQFFFFLTFGFHMFLCLLLASTSRPAPPDPDRFPGLIVEATVIRFTYFPFTAAGRALITESISVWAFSLS